jgi:20S proteasome alpha/beta subunit
MTLLVALKGNDGMVLAADSRGTFGDPRGVTAQNDTQQKVHILSKHVAILVAGSGELGALIVDLVRQELASSNIDGATEVLTVLRNLVRAKYSEWFPSLPPVPPPMLVMSGQAASRPELTFIVAGYEHDGTPKLFTLTSQLDFPPMQHDYGFALQGIAQYALYLLNRLYESNRTKEELTPLAVYAITETASQDGKVGGPVRVVTIEPGDQGCQFMAADVVQQIQDRNSSRGQALRDSFYSRGK